MPGLFAQHPLQAAVHHTPNETVTQVCPSCLREFTGPARSTLHRYQEHVYDAHLDEIEDCGSCGCYHWPDFYGDCREDWERF